MQIYELCNLQVLFLSLNEELYEFVKNNIKFLFPIELAVLIW